MSKKNKEKTLHKTSVGGQALIEGIMMQGPKGAAMSVRMPDGTISTEPKTVKHIKDKYKIFGIPLIRGIVAFIESMIFGYKCLMESAEKSGLDDSEQSEEEMSKLDKWLSDHFGPKMMTALSAIAAVIGFALSFFLFMYLPATIVDLIDDALKNITLDRFEPLLEGILRMAIFVAYIFLVSRMKEIKRVFMYHGAEHKTIFCYEHGCELTVENVRRQSRFHPRCGTSFMFVMIIISVLISSAIVLIFPGVDKVRMVWIGVKILILPLVMGLGYEFIKYAGRHDNILVKILSAPGLWMQRLTTVEPDDSMIEVGLEAFKAVITDNPEDDAL
ncbi:MAG: DUF1385 domain-containing protein [Clostridiales bacterium]|nr:DUF1385 domain-containing protein [Clostridiales bacterium]